MFIQRTICLAVLWAALVTTAGQVQAELVIWNATSGLKPDEITPAYSLFDTADPENPVLASDILTLSTNVNAELMGYRMIGSTLDMPAMPVIEFNMRMVSSFSTATQRGGAVVSITTQSNVGNALYFENDKVFFLQSPGTRGPEAVIDTDGSFHDYRIEVSGLAAGNTITLYQDNVSVLSHVLWNDVFGDFGPEEAIVFGNNTSVARGTSEWKSFQHNAAAIPEPSSFMLVILGLSAFLPRDRR